VGLHSGEPGVRALSRIYSCFNEKLYFESPYSFPGLRNKYLPEEYGVKFGSIDEGYSPSQHAENFRRFLLFVRDNISDTTGHQER
jgi:hypothetical protein